MVARVEMYVEIVDDVRKYDVIFATVVKDGKAHLEEGEGATKLDAGPFVLVNTGGFGAEVMAEKAKLCEDAATLMRNIGLGKVCYGEVLLSNRLTGNSAVAAFYTPSKDEMFVRADAGKGRETVRIICHELAHRFVTKFMKDRGLLPELYETIAGHSTKVPKPKPGDKLRHGAGFLTVHRIAGPRITLVDEQMLAYTFTRDEYKQLYEIASQNHYRFVTPYARKGGPEENFAEMVSFHALGLLPKEQVELLQPLLG